MYRFQIFRPYWSKLAHGVTTKKWGGDFKEDSPGFEESVFRLRMELNLEAPVSGLQEHGDEILEVAQKPSGRPRCDAFITQTKGLPLMVKTADCQGVLMYDPVTGTIAAVHSGWKGSTINIIGKTIRKMWEKFAVLPENLLIGIGPSLGPCCSSFSDPKRELPENCHEFIEGKNVDFWALSLEQCCAAGVPIENIEIARECTKCKSDQYYSYRNNDQARMANVIALRA